MVSIIIPVYNTEHYLVKCLDSCFVQSYSDIEVIAINDGSTDGSGDILDDYAKKEPRLRVFHQSNAGVVVARNVGITAAKGEWLMFVDSDDYIHMDAFIVLHDCATAKNADIVFGRLCVDVRGSLRSVLGGSVDLCSKKTIACALMQNQLTTSLCGKLFKASLFDDLEIAEHLKIGEDAYMIIQLFQNAKTISSIQDIVYYYYQRSNSVMHHPSKSDLASHLVFIDMVIHFYSTKDYYTDNAFKDALAWFILKEYFSYLRMGGDYADLLSQKRDVVINNNLQNKTAISLTPLWRILMLKSYILSPVLGNIYRFCFVKLRSLLR